MPVLAMDDGCSDANAAAMAAWTHVEGIRIVWLTRRSGRDAAIAAGLQVAHGDLMVVLQGDDARASELIAGLLVKWRQGFDIVHSAQAQVARSVATQSERRLPAPGARFTSMRTAHRALLIDCSALADSTSPHAHGSGSTTRQPARPLQMAALPTSPLLAAGPSASGPSGGFGRWAKRALGVRREAGRSIGSRLARSVVDAVFEIRGELGSGLAPRTKPLVSQSAGFNELAEPHA